MVPRTKASRRSRERDPGNSGAENVTIRETTEQKPQFVKLCCELGPMVYWLGSRIFTPWERVRFPLGLRCLVSEYLLRVFLRYEHRKR